MDRAVHLIRMEVCEYRMSIIENLDFIPDCPIRAEVQAVVCTRRKFYFKSQDEVGELCFRASQTTAGMTVTNQPPVGNGEIDSLPPAKILAVEHRDKAFSVV